MSTVSLCQDGLEVELENSDGLWLALRTGDEHPIRARFPVDPSELRATAAGGLAWQASDGQGNNVTIDGNGGRLVLRLECNGHTSKRCVVSLEKIQEALHIPKS